MSVLSFVFKVLPSRAQHTALDAMLESQRQFYNAALQERIGAWCRGVSIGLNDQTKSLTEIRKFDADIGSVPYNVSKWTLNPHSPSKSLILLSGSQYFRYKSWC